ALDTAAASGADEAELATVYEHHGDYEVPDVDRSRAQLVLEAARRKAVAARAESACPQVSPGHVFELEEHPFVALNGRYVVHGVEHKRLGRGQLASGVSQGGLAYANVVRFGPAERAYR